MSTDTVGPGPVSTDTVGTGTLAAATPLAALHGAVDHLAPDLVTLSHRIHDLAEVAFEESESAQACRDLLAHRGFRLSDVPGLPTAFVARRGTGRTVLTVCCEYDALPEVGHACGHNVIAASGVGAGVALAGVLDAADFTVQVVGCPAEEYGGGKALLLDAGVFNDSAVAVMAHPGDHDSADFASWAFVSLGLSVRGAACGTVATALVDRLPGEGIGVRLAVPAVRVRGPEAELTIDLRDLDADRLATARAQVERLARTLAASRRCVVSTRELEPPYLDFRPDASLVAGYTRHARTLGRDVGPSRGRFAMTDMGNVSHRVPALHAMVDISGGRYAPHSREFVGAARSPRADRAVLDAATALAATLTDAASAGVGPGPSATAGPADRKGPQ